MNFIWAFFILFLFEIHVNGIFWNWSFISMQNGLRNKTENSSCIWQNKECILIIAYWSCIAYWSLWPNEAKNCIFKLKFQHDLKSFYAVNRDWAATAWICDRKHYSKGARQFILLLIVNNNSWMHGACIKLIIFSWKN